MALPNEKDGATRRAIEDAVSQQETMHGNMGEQEMFENNFGSSEEGDDPTRARILADVSQAEENSGVIANYLRNTLPGQLRETAIEEFGLHVRPLPENTGQPFGKGRQFLAG